MDKMDSEHDSGRPESEEGKKQKEFESKLDEYANKISQAVSEGVKRVEEAFERGRENLKAEGGEGGVKSLKGSPRMGTILIGLGIVWLLYIAGLFDHIIFPILLIVIGIYFVVRNR